MEIANPREIQIPGVKFSKLPRLNHVTEIPTIVTCRVCRGERVIYIRGKGTTVLTKCIACNGSGQQDNTHFDHHVKDIGI